MIIGVIGSGGREHAICLGLKNSSKIEKIYCFPGNAGTSEIAENVILDLDNFENIKSFILNKQIDLVVVGPEKPLVDGLVDFLEKSNNSSAPENQIISLSFLIQVFCLLANCLVFVFIKFIASFFFKSPEIYIIASL